MNIFVSGSDTDIGKTVIAAILALKLQYHYWKPIQSGLLSETDSQWVAGRIGADRVYPETYRLQQPLSPHLSARLQGVQIDLQKILNECPAKNTIIEGAGGLLVPVNQTQLMIDLIQQIAAPLVLVVRSKLGTLNHTLLSLESLRQRGIERVAVIMVGDRNDENKKAIEYYGKVPVIGEIPWLDSLDPAALMTAGALINMDIKKLEKLQWK